VRGSWRQSAPLDDDQLADKTGISPRQTVYEAPILERTSAAVAVLLVVGRLLRRVAGR
jgi:hypothetical protein